MIWKVQTYMDDAGHTVNELTSQTEASGSLVDPQAGEPQRKLQGSAMIGVPTEGGGIMPVPVEFDFENSATLTIEEAFEGFEAEMQRFIESKNRESQSRIITPGRMG